MANEVGDGELLMYALGRDFELGTLYDARKDNIISAGN